MDHSLDNGLQAMAVAQLDKSGTPDLSHVVIAYAGTNSGDIKDVVTDVEHLGFGFKNTHYLRNYTDSQFTSAKEFADEIARKYPNAEISTTGHSLGESLAMYVAVQNNYPNVGFNGPDISAMISRDQVRYMQTHPEQFRNYRNPNDKIGNITGNTTQTALYVDLDNQIGILDDHSLSAWKFDKKGKVIDLSRSVQTVGETDVASIDAFMKHQYATEKSELEKGGLSASERIQLDYLSATAVASRLSSLSYSSKDLFELIYDTAANEFKMLYEKTKDHLTTVNKLSEDEIKSLYKEEGVSYDTMVNQPMEHFSDRKEQIDETLGELIRLKDQLKLGMEQMRTQESNLGREIDVWSKRIVGYSPEIR